MSLVRQISTVALILVLSLAGCSGDKAGTEAGAGRVELGFVDSLASGQLVLKAAYLRSGDEWTVAAANGTTYDFQGTGGNLTSMGDVPAGSYDRLRLLFTRLTVAGRTAQMTESGVEVSANVTVLAGATTSVQLDFLWKEALFESPGGLAFAPVLSLLVVNVDGTESLRLAADDIGTGSGKAPVARMRVFDATGLEVFVSSFVAESPTRPVVGNAGNLTLSATASEALQPGARIAQQSWDIGGVVLEGNTVTWPAPVNGGNFTVRLTVKDTEGNQDSQTVTMLLKPGLQSRTIVVEGSASGAGSCVSGTCPPWNDAGEHRFAVNVTDLDGVPANLTHVRLVLTPGAATVPLADLDVTFDDPAGKRIGAQTGTGSQHVIDTDVQGVASGDWVARVMADPGYEATYSISLTLTWRGVNPALEALLSQYDDGHSHEH